MALFGTNLKKLLEKNGLTEMMLAQKLGITQQAVNEWISKGTTPRAKRLDQIAKILGVTVNQLFYAESEAPIEKQTKSDKTEEMVPRAEAEEWKEKYLKVLEKLNQQQEQQIGQLQKQTQSLKNIPMVPPDK